MDRLRFIANIFNDETGILCFFHIHAAIVTAKGTIIEENNFVSDPLNFYTLYFICRP